MTYSDIIVYHLSCLNIFVLLRLCLISLILETGKTICCHLFSMCEMGFLLNFFFFICYFCKFTEKYWCANSSSVLVLFMNKKVLKEERVCLSCSTQFSVESYRSFSLWNFTYKVRLTNGSVRPMTLTGEK